MSDRSAQPEDALSLLLGWIRAGHKLRALGREIGAVTEGGGGAWGVLHSLVTEGPQTVPQLARSRPVSRQHIQTIANELMAAAMVESRPNPAHRRSRLLTVTARGRDEYERVRAALLRATAGLFTGIAQDDVDAARQMLGTILARLDTLLADVAITETSAIEY